jgi:large subunit ribosomal protein L10Ae
LTLRTLLCSKLSTEALKEAITQVVTDAKEKNRKFTETIELQIGLKNYDPQKDKRFSGSVKLPHIPRPKMRVCMLGDASHVDQVYYIASLWALHFMVQCLTM